MANEKPFRKRNKNTERKKVSKAYRREGLQGYLFYCSIVNWFSCIHFETFIIFIV